MIVGLSEVANNDTTGCHGFLSLFSQCLHLNHHTEHSDSNTHSLPSPAPAPTSIVPSQPLIPPSSHNLGISRTLFIKSLAGCSFTSEQTHLAGFPSKLCIDSLFRSGAEEIYLAGLIVQLLNIGCFFFGACVRYFSHHGEKILDKSQLRKTGCSAGFEGSVHHGRPVRSMRPRQSGHRETFMVPPIVLPCLQSRTPTHPGRVLPTLGVACPTSVKPL